MTIVCWKWKNSNYQKKEFTSWHVNRLAAMVRRHLGVPHELICVTDDPSGLDKDIRPVPLPEIPDLPVLPGRPNCFLRLWAFSDRARAVFGDAFIGGSGGFKPQTALKTP